MLAFSSTLKNWVVYIWISVKKQSRKSFWLDFLLCDILLICCNLFSTPSDFLLSVKAACDNRRFLAWLSDARLKVSDIFPSRVWLCTITQLCTCAEKEPTVHKLQLIRSFWGFFIVLSRLFDRTSD